MSGSVGGGNFVGPAQWILGSWPPDEAIAKVNVTPNNNSCAFVVANGRGYFEQQLAGDPANDGQVVNLSCFFEGITAVDGNILFINQVGGTVLRAPATPTVAGQRIDMVFRLSDAAFQIRVGAGASAQGLGQDFEVSRPQVTRGDELRAYQPTQLRVPELQFAGDTFITLPDASVIVNSGTDRFSYTFRADDLSSNRYIWNSADDIDFDRISLDTTRWGTRRGNILVNYSALGGLQEGVEYELFARWGPVQTLEPQIPGVGSGSSAAFDGTDNTGGTWWIGKRDLSPGEEWIGMIKDFRIFNSAGVVVHHWPINDGVADGGLIRDIIGGQDGVLTLGAGSWE